MFLTAFVWLESSQSIRCLWLVSVCMGGGRLFFWGGGLNGLLQGYFFSLFCPCDWEGWPLIRLCHRLNFVRLMCWKAEQKLLLNNGQQRVGWGGGGVVARGNTAPKTGAKASCSRSRCGVLTQIALQADDRILQAKAGFVSFRENATHIPATETATAQKSRGRYNANVVGGFDFSQPLQRSRSVWQQRLSLSPPVLAIFFHASSFLAGVLERVKKKSLTAFSYLFDPKRLSRNGRNGYNGLNASEGEKASPSNQFRGWVRARFPQTAPDPSGGVQGELADVRCQRRARSRSISEAKWPFGDFLSNHSDAGAGKRVKVSCCLGRGRAI